MQVPLQVSHLRNGAFWLFALFLFGYFFIMAAYYPFFPLWLHDINQLSKSDTGLVFGSIALFALAFQPIMGPLSDKLGLRKTLIAIIVGLLVLSAPFLFMFSARCCTRISNSGRWSAAPIWALSLPADRTL